VRLATFHVVGVPGFSDQVHGEVGLLELQWGERLVTFYVVGFLALDAGVLQWDEIIHFGLRFTLKSATIAQRSVSGERRTSVKPSNKMR
jgi:hypothetical protein